MPKKKPQLGRELGLLAEQIGGAIKAAARSQELSALRTDAKAIGNKLSAAVRKAASSPEARQIQGQTRKVVSLGGQEGLKAAQKLRREMSSALSAAAAELRRLSERVRRKS